MRLSVNKWHSLLHLAKFKNEPKLVNMKFNVLLLSLCLAFLVSPIISQAQTLLERQAQERADLLTEQKQEIISLQSSLTRTLPSQMAQIRRDFNAALRIKINEIRVELIAVRKAELAAALNDRMRQRAIDSFIRNLQSRINAERSSLREIAQEALREIRADIGVQLRALSQTHRVAFKELLAIQKQERIDAAKAS